MHIRRTLPAARRRGVILMVVLAMLTLLAIMGVSFVLYASSEATAARVAKEAEVQNRADLDPELALSLFLGQLIYDCPDDYSGIYSSLRGHSLARLMYGNNDTANALNDKPYSGPGPLHFASPFPKSTAPGATDDYNLVNFTYWSADGFLRDPERINSRTGPSAAKDTNFTACNVSYTYPDRTNMFLAMVRASDGQVLVPSFYRQWIFDTTKAGYPGNPNWTNTEGKYLTCFVRPADVDPSGTKFPSPDSNGLWVKNLDNSPGGNDSGWMDIGAPVMTTPSGLKFKMLVAPLIMELDSKLNLNAIGNLMGTNGGVSVHASNQGWGIHEINPTKLLNSSTATNEWMNLFVGNPPPSTLYSSAYGSPAASRTYGRYGYSRLPQGAPITGGTSSRQWGQVDFEGTQDPPPAALSGAWSLPSGTGTPYTCFPTFPANAYQNGPNNETQDSSKNNIHPLIYNAQRPKGDNRLLPVSALMPLYRYGATNSDALSSDLYRLLPMNLFNDNGSPADPLCAKRRRLCTLLSADLDRAGGPPYVWDLTDSGMPTTHYSFSAGLYPTGTSITFPATTNRGATPANSEFDANSWRSISAALLKLDLNRKLTDYPTPDATTGAITDMTGYTNALNDRTNFATDIFNRLRAATGALDPGTVESSYGLTSNEFKALRYLAQLAVNIVDYIDYDDYNTPFTWYKDTKGNLHNVFGTELPRLVLNEFYVSYDNDWSEASLAAAAGSQKAMTNYRVNVWVELFNPFILDSVPNSPYGQTDQKAILHNGTNTIYEVVLAKPGIGASVIRDSANTTGDPDFGLTAPATNVQTTAAGTPAIVGPNDWVPTRAPTSPTAYAPSPTFPVPAGDKPDYRVVNAANSAYSATKASSGSNVINGGFYVLGPDTGAAWGMNKTTMASADPGLPATTLRTEMSYPIAITNWNVAPLLKPPTVLLRRLACPGLPVQTDSTKANYNPYLTIDYIEAQDPSQVNDDRMFDTTGPLAPQPGAITGFKSWGRTQPYTAVVNQQMAQNPQTPAANQPLTTFFRQNAVEDAAPISNTPPGGKTQTVKIPFDWLVHLDRQLISPMELLHVSGFKLHELTQQFVDNTTGTPFSHRAPWGTSPSTTSTDQLSRIYRLFEFVETKSRAGGVAQGGRVPGKININMVWDLEVFRALCDAQQANLFYGGSGMGDANVDAVFNAMIKQRSPTSDGASGYMPGGSDAPFWGFGVGPAGGGDALDNLPPATATPRGIRNTLLRDGPTPMMGNATKIFDPFPADAAASPPYTIATSPYQRFELLTKIFNNLTTRSNCFAVWLTVGFFEVTNDTVLPVQLGAEIGAAEGRQIRHRMFAIVDRTNLAAFNTTTNTAITASTTSQALPLTATSGTHPNTGRAWSVQPGSVLVIAANTDDDGTGSEQGEETVVVDANSKAVFTKNHRSGATVIGRGNPGPWPRYDPRQDTLVVPYFAIID